MANWNKITSRGNVEDRRSLAPVVSGISLTGIALLFVVNYLTGGDLGDVLRQIEQIPPQTQQVTDNSQFEGQDEYEVFASTVLGSTNDAWDKQFNQGGKTYTQPKLVLFRTSTQSACGSATSAVGPHYCPYDETIYLDETFFDELTNRFGAQGGDVAQAYVIAHEVGHHVQNQLGTLDQMTQRSSVAIELQADCFAGLWANTIKGRGILEPGEIEEAMDAAAAVGDDRIQEKVQGYVSPETWTHGSSTQRVQAFDAGYESGSFSSCTAL